MTIQIIITAISCCLLVSACAASPARPPQTSAYSPHTPSAAPWFEGWYMRIQADGTSAAFGLGHYPDQDTDKPRAACFLIHRDNAEGAHTTEDHFYMPHNLDVTTHPDRCPGDGSGTGCIPAFQVLATHGDNSSCQLAFEADTVRIRYNTSRYTFQMTFPNRAADVVPWSPHQLSPMGWLAAPPFSSLIKLQWFVYSLRTPASYTLEDHMTGSTLAEVDGHVHLEKNWGTGFPASWLWSQGQGSAHVTPPGTATAEPMSTPAAYVLAGGRVPHALDRLLQPQIFSFSFHSPLLNVTIDPNHPPIWEQVMDVSGCRGTAQVKLRTWQHVVRLTVSASPRDFADVTCPNKDGFMDLAVEAFSATTSIQIFAARGLFSAPGELLAEASFQGAALEFGGTYRCDGAPQHAAKHNKQQEDAPAQPETIPLLQHSEL